MTQAKPKLLSFFLAAFLASCEFSPFEPLPPDLPGGAPIRAPIDLYVAPSGNDDNSCLAPTDPCRTLQAAVDKASATDSVHLAAGTYPSPGDSEYFAVIDQSITIVGAGRDATILNARGIGGGLYIYGVRGVTIRDLSIRNGATVGASSGITFDSDSGEGRVENVHVANFTYRGIFHQGEGRLTLVDVLVEDITISNTAIGIEAADCVIQESEIREIAFNGVLCSQLIMENSWIRENENNGVVIAPMGAPTSNIISDTVIENNDISGLELIGASAVLNRVTISGNGLWFLEEGLSAAHGSPGIALSEGSSLEVNNSTISGNYRGIWIRNSGGSILVRSTQISDNLTAAIYSDTFPGGAESSIVLINTEISGNNSSELASGAAIISQGNLEIRGSTISANSGGALTHGRLASAVIVETIIEGTVNPIRAQDTAVTNFGDMRIERSLIANNAMYGVYFGGNLEMVNTTVSGNEGYGVVSYGEGSLALSFVTIVENHSGGVFWYADRGAAASVESSLIQSCTVAPFGPPSWVTMSGVNISLGGSCGFLDTYTPEELLLGPLADNSGPTWTHALLEGSPAIDRITDGCITEDQRNLFRPNNDACDVGAFEYHFAIPGFIGAQTDTILIAIPTSNTNCRLGNSTAFDIADTLFEGVQYTPIGRGADNLWLLFEGPATQRNCWGFAGGLKLTVDDEPVDPEDIALELLPVVAYPAPPQEPDGDDGDQGEGGSAPAAPANAYINQTCTDQEYKVQLVWFDAANNEDGYRIYRDGNPIATKAADSEQHTDNPPLGGPYTYKIEAFNGSGAASTTVEEAGCLP